MADKKISELTAAGALTGAETLPLVQTGTTKKVTLDEIVTFVGAEVGSYTDEDARDALGTALVGGTGITVTPNDGSDTITITGTVTQYTDEMAQDAIGAMRADSSTVTLTYVDATPSLTAAVVAGSIGATQAAAALKDASYCGLVRTPAVETLTIDLKVPVACTINELAGKLVSGTCTAKVQIDGVDVTGTSTAFSSTEAAGTASAANSAAAGSTISLVFTAVSSPVDFAFTIKATVA